MAVVTFVGGPKHAEVLTIPEGHPPFHLYLIRPDKVNVFAASEEQVEPVRGTYLLAPSRPFWLVSGIDNVYSWMGWSDGGS
jgi:hypothetical protein